MIALLKIHQRPSHSLCSSITDFWGRAQISHTRSLQWEPEIRMWVILKSTLIFQPDNSHISNLACHNLKSRLPFWMLIPLLKTSKYSYSMSKHFRSKAVKKSFPRSTSLLCQEQKISVFYHFIRWYFYFFNIPACAMYANDLLTLGTRSTSGNIGVRDIPKK